jgi:hypothetical protein
MGRSDAALPEPTGVDYKAEAEATIIRDVDLGELLAVDYTPEQEKRVVRKLDFAYAPLRCLTS